MTRRKCETFTNDANGRSATLYRDVEWQEWQVAFTQAGVYNPDADYHTDDKEDARQTAQSWVNGRI